MRFTQSKNSLIQTWTLDIASFIANVAVTMIGLALVDYLRGVFSLAPSLIGISTQVPTITYFLGCMFLNPLVQNLKPRHCVAIALIGMSCFLVLFVTTSSLPMAYVAIGIYGLFMSMLWPAIEAWFSRGKEGEELNHAMNGFNFSWSFGVGLATYFSGILIEKSYTLPFVVGIVLLLFTCVSVSLIAFLIPGMRSAASEKEAKEQEMVDHSTPLRYLCWVGIVLVYTGMSVIQNIFPLYASDMLGIGASQTGALLLVRGIVTCLTFVVLAKSSFWQFSRKTILLDQLVFGLLCLTGAFFHSIAFFILFFFAFGIVFAFGYCLSMFHGVSGCLNRTKRMAVHETLLTLGQIIGACCGGFIYERFSFETILLSYGIVTLVVVAVESAIRIRK
jgi:predicted MFS family arabinose efflux permease